MDKTGGAAFPCTTGSDGGTMYDGMTLLDYFAGQALQGELASQDARNDGKGTGVVTEDSMAGFAERCYDIAAAMLTEKSKREAGE